MIKKRVYIILITTFLFCIPQTLCQKKAIVIGATAGMGRAVARLLAQDGYIMGLIGRRIPLLESLQKEIGGTSYIKAIDVSKHEQAAKELKELINQMGGLDLILISISAFADIENNTDRWVRDKKVLDVDLVGFWVMAHVAIEFFEKQKSGHLVGISSISGIRGEGSCPVYCGAKAFISKYLEGIRNRMIHYNIPVYVTDIVPGWVDVESCMLSEVPGTYWVATLNRAAKQIFEAIQERKKVAYITKKWELIAALLRENPNNMFEGFYNFESLKDLVLDK